jgi:predicted esterase YcpF (UPF0227 family)
MPHYKCSFHNWNQTGGLRGKDANQQEFYAKLSSVAYGNTTEGRAAKLAKYKMTDWVQDTALSTPDVAVLYNPKTKEMVSAITGSRFTSRKHALRDIKSDIGIAAGVDRLGKRTSEVKAVVKKAKSKYKDYDATLTGHSLGGRTAQNISKSTGIPAVAYNIGSSPLGAVTDKIAKWFGRDHKDSNVIHYTTNSIKNATIDPLSVSGAVLGDSNETVAVKKKTDAISHSLTHFGAGKGTAVSYETYRTVAKRYGIRLTTGSPRRKKTSKEFQKEIRAHERNR